MILRSIETFLVSFKDLFFFPFCSSGKMFRETTVARLTFRQGLTVCEVFHLDSFLQEC